MTSLKVRNQVLIDIDTAIMNGSSQNAACTIVGITPRTLQRWKEDKTGDKRPMVKKISFKALNNDEKKLIVDTCNLPKYRDSNPNQIVPILAEKGTYIASESSFYKVLRENDLLKHRSNTNKPKKRPAPDELVATGSNQVLSWDITYLRTNVKGIFFYLYIFMDIWSRKISGWRIETTESGDVASEIITNICDENKIESIYLHSDNGSPMKCGTMLATLNWLGVTPSFSRPLVSNDNAYSESLFKTLKYKAGYPKAFETIDEAREWVEGFVTWYNNEHRHSGIKFVTPEQRHTGKDVNILKRRHMTYLAAKGNNPLRWSGKTRDWSYIETVILNKKTEEIKIRKIA